MYWAVILAVIGIMYVLFVLLIKRKFKGQTVHYQMWELLDDGTGLLKPESTESITLGFSPSSLSPARASMRSYHGLKLVAENNGRVIIDGRSIAKVAKKYGTSAISQKGT